MRTSDVPEFGPLHGVKVVCTGSAIAGPIGASLMAETGATVIQVESARFPDSQHGTLIWPQEHRNQLNMAVDIPSEDGREVFFKLIEWADIWIESSKGGTYTKWGLTDEEIWKHNPRIAIVHVSGFGQTGVPEYVNRASYDAVGQAFSGYMFMNGTPETPLVVNPYVCDYVTAINCCWSALACYTKAQATGVGESVDIAQYETLVRIMNQQPMQYLNNGIIYPRTGNKDNLAAGYSFYDTKDGKVIYIGMTGAGPAKRGYGIIGLPVPGTGDPDFPEGFGGTMIDTPLGQRIERAFEEYCASHDLEEIEAAMSEARVPFQRVNSLEDCVNDPQFIAREVFTEWEDPVWGKVKGVGLINKFKNNPAQIWRGAPMCGQDNEDILYELGFSDEQIASLYESHTIVKMDRETTIKSFRLDVKEKG